jgi:hypothetical protein
MLGGQQFEQTNGRSGFLFPMRFDGGRLDFVTQGVLRSSLAVG